MPSFWVKVMKTDSCWIWQGTKTQNGYGQIKIAGTKYAAHRLAYAALVGLIADGLVLDHLCRQPSCVNPAHLEAVSQRENTLRGVGPCAENAKRTHCPQGHPYSGKNLILRRGKRECRHCHIARCARQFQRRRAEIYANARARYRRAKQRQG